MTEIELEKLRMKLIQRSLEFLTRFKDDASYLAFEDVEKRRIEGLLKASPKVLMNTAIVMKDVLETGYIA
jgi:hypothetical protein